MTDTKTHTTGSSADDKAPTDKQVHLILTLEDELEGAINKITQEGTKKECSHLIDVLLTLKNDYVIHPRLPKRDEKDAKPSSDQ